MGAGRDRGDQRNRQKQDRERPWPPCPGLPAPAAPCLLARLVGDQLVELGVGLRCQAAVEPCVELVGVETPFQVALPQDVTDGVAFLVADAKRAVARAVVASCEKTPVPASLV